ncbi:MAG: FtsX-like permease family protein [Saprospiraceae bacterium]|nr:FtsX-like permease family protein [Saprospiraceae bacterium]
MSYLKLVWKNIWLHPLRSMFNIILLSITIALVIILLLINKQFGNHLGKESEGTDIILCAKGSPLQSVLCNIFHIDAPTGNITIEQIKPFLNPAHPLIKKALPLALGDSYNNTRIVGTTLDYFETKSINIREGRFFEKDFEVILGSEIADRERMQIGSTIQSNHGLADLEGEMQHEHQLKVVGILKKTNSVADKLIFTTISTYWAEHEKGHEHDHEEDTVDHVHYSTVLRNSELVDNDHEISSLLIQFKGNNVQSLNFGRSINENFKIMAVSPPIEISRLYELTNTASDLLYWIAIILGILSTFALFINLIQALQERRQELAIMRISGAQPSLLFFILISEGIIICILGSFLGLILGHGFLYIASEYFQLGSKYGIRADVFFNEEYLIIAVTLLCGLVASIVPAIRAYRQDIVENLKD